MTIGTLSRRTGVRVKALRAYEDMGLIYTVGRSPGNYRLFGDEALWCVGVVGALRALLRRRGRPAGTRGAPARAGRAGYRRGGRPRGRRLVRAELLGGAGTPTVPSAAPAGWR
jgi:hypothetical protein